MHHVDGKMFKTIHNLYANAKSCVRLGHAKSESFVSNVGFRQGENLRYYLSYTFYFMPMTQSSLQNRKKNCNQH